MALGSRTTLIRGEAYLTVPWKNGGGTTREIVAGEGYRLSVATIASDGWFSDFSGYDRTIVPIYGDGIALTIDGMTTVLDEPFVPLEFAGEARTWCRLLGGAAEDFNVMTERSRWKHSVNVCRVRDRRLQLAIGPLCFIYVLEGTVLGAGAGDTVCLKGPDALELEHEHGPALACVVSLFTAT